MISALIKELETRTHYLGGEEISTLYFGGGTPSLLTKDELQSILKAVKTNYKLKDKIEFTLEANPDDINQSQCALWKSVGVNRLSIGLQSFLQDDLEWMNRAHTAKESTKSVKTAIYNGFSTTVDLIYGLPNRTKEDWKNNIDQLIDLGPAHISAYCLTVEKQTALHHMIKKGDLPKVDEEDQAQQFEILVERMRAAGYEQYEISNFAKDKAYSQHNSNYWKGVKYLGIGPSAHSFDGESRRWNLANNHKYIKGLEQSKKYYEEEILTPKDRFNELLLTGLRTKWGVDLDQLKFKHCFTTAFQHQLDEFENYQLIKVVDQKITLTEKGKLQADYIAAMLFLE